ncbi:MAG: peptidoglycan-binding protein [Candidatus Hamiltonella defensa (Ceratovacuna japonica)]
MNPLNAVKSAMKLEKLTIYAYDYAQRSQRQKTAPSFQALFNPESYSIFFKNTFSRFEQTQYLGEMPQYLAVTLLLDNTGVMSEGILPVNPGQDVQQEVKRFLKLTYDIYGKTHEARYLTLEWGRLSFDCRLSSVDVNFTLFDRDGTPLRAELAAVFIQDVESQKRVLLEDKQSPDLSHIKLVTRSDTLPLMAYEAYNDVDYYLHLAQHNRLDNFRRLQVGSTLRIPPSVDNH